MFYVVNIEKEKNEKLGIVLMNKNNNVFIDDISEQPNKNIRDKLLIGDNILSVNGIKSENAIYTSKIIVNSGPHLSICLKRQNNSFFEKNKKIKNYNKLFF